MRMHRWLLVLLLVVMPVQFVWAAAAPYCGHETSESASKHFGHHFHKHQGSTTSDASKAGGAGVLGGDDVDCVLCHLGCIQPPLNGYAVPGDAPSVFVLPMVAQHCGVPLPDRIERPKWAATA